MFFGCSVCSVVSFFVSDPGPLRYLPFKRFVEAEVAAHMLDCDVIVVASSLLKCMLDLSPNVSITSGISFRIKSSVVPTSAQDS